MNKRTKRALLELPKEELINIICQMDRSLGIISEWCVDESKSNTTSERAVCGIREAVYHMPDLWELKNLRETKD